MDTPNKKVILTASSEREYEILFAAVMDLPEILEQYVDKATKVPSKVIEVKQ